MHAGPRALSLCWRVLPIVAGLMPAGVVGACTYEVPGVVASRDALADGDAAPDGASDAAPRDAATDPATEAQRAGDAPGTPDVDACAAPRVVTIAPAVGGVTQWDLDSQGKLALGDAGTWTVAVASCALTTNIKVWGAGGGGSYANGGTGGGGAYVDGTATLLPGTTYTNPRRRRRRRRGHERPRRGGRVRGRRLRGLSQRRGEPRRVGRGLRSRRPESSRGRRHGMRRGRGRPLGRLRREHRRRERAARGGRRGRRRLQLVSGWLRRSELGRLRGRRRAGLGRSTTAGGNARNERPDGRRGVRRRRCVRERHRRRWRRRGRLLRRWRRGHERRLRRRREQLRRTVVGGDDVGRGHRIEPGQRRGDADNAGSGTGGALQAAGSAGRVILE